MAPGPGTAFTGEPSPVTPSAILRCGFAGMSMSDLVECTDSVWLDNGQPKKLKINPMQRRWSPVIGAAAPGLMDERCPNRTAWRLPGQKTLAVTTIAPHMQ
jgi:hypothetical protein